MRDEREKREREREEREREKRERGREERERIEREERERRDRRETEERQKRDRRETEERQKRDRRETEERQKRDRRETEERQKRDRRETEERERGRERETERERSRYQCKSPKKRITRPTALVSSSCLLVCTTLPLVSYLLEEGPKNGPRHVKAECHAIATKIRGGLICQVAAWRRVPLPANPSPFWPHFDPSCFFTIKYLNLGRGARLCQNRALSSWKNIGKSTIYHLQYYHIYHKWSVKNIPQWEVYGIGSH